MGQLTGVGLSPHSSPSLVGPHPGLSYCRGLKGGLTARGDISPLETSGQAAASCRR